MFTTRQLWGTLQTNPCFLQSTNQPSNNPGWLRTGFLAKMDYYQNPQLIHLILGKYILLQSSTNHHIHHLSTNLYIPHVFDAQIQIVFMVCKNILCKSSTPQSQDVQGDVVAHLGGNSPGVQLAGRNFWGFGEIRENLPEVSDLSRFFPVNIRISARFLSELILGCQQCWTYEPMYKSLVNPILP